jgi:MarR family transcriptional regulator for hemolysin
MYVCIMGEEKMQEEDRLESALLTPGHLISLASRGFTRLSEARLKPLGFGVGQLPVLVALHTRRADTQQELARFARMRQPPMAQMLARMERDGFIRRTGHPDDGRSSRITLTDFALERLPKAIAALFQGNRDALVGFSAEESEQFMAMLRRLIENLDLITSDCSETQKND